jgi:hypothetical protein
MLDGIQPPNLLPAEVLRALTDFDQPQKPLITNGLSSLRAPVRQAALDNIQNGHNENWSRPLTPFENRVRVAIRAGEKVFGGEGH